jgi:hypothetical protein
MHKVISISLNGNAYLMTRYRLSPPVPLSPPESCRGG